MRIARAGLVGAGFLAAVAAVVAPFAGRGGETRADTGWAFTAAAAYAVGTQPVAIAAADFDRDGVLDLAVANEGSGDVSILRGLGDGTFDAAASVAVGPAITALWAGDATLDGKADLVLLRAGQTGVEIHAGQGDGTFAAASSVQTGSRAGGTSVAAFDWVPGYPPHFAAAVGGDEVAVAERQAGGTFAGADIAVTGLNETRCLAVGDMIGEGWKDLVVGGAGGTRVCSTAGPGATVLWTVDGAIDARGVVAVDLDRDGLVDVVSVGSPAPTVGVFRNEGAGTFQARGRIVAGTEGRAVAAADFDGDGVPDLAVVHSSGWVLFRGAGNMMLEGPNLTATGNDLTAVAVGDFDRDGRPDVAVASRGDGTVEVRLDRVTWPKGGSWQEADAGTTGAGPFEPVAGDLDRDGRPDVVTVAYDGNLLSTFLGTQTGMSAGTTYPAQSQPRALALADLDHDGLLDVVWGDATGSAVEVHLGGAAGFGAPTAWSTGPWPYDTEVGDVNRDGHLDLVVSHSWYFGPGIVATLLGHGDGTFDDPIVATVGLNPSNLVLGDFDRDGVLDAAVTNTNLGNASTVSVLIGAGDGTFAAAVDYAVGAGPQQVAAADFDRDGVLDLAVANANSRSVSTLRGRGDGTFEAKVDVTLPDANSRPVGVLAGDFDRDGKPDLVVCDIQATGFWTLPGTGDGTFGAPRWTDLGSVATSAVSADLFARDGLPDLAVTTYGDGQVRFLRGVAPQMPVIAADPLDLGTFLLGDAASSSGDVVVRNAGSVALHVTGAELVGLESDAFTTDWTPGQVTVPTGGSTTIGVTCVAAAAGTVETYLRITSDDPETPVLDVAVQASPTDHVVFPAEGAVGTEIWFSGAVGPKGKAALKLGRKKIPLKVVEWTTEAEGAPGSAHLSFVPRKAKPGVYDLVLTAKRKKPVTWAGEFTVVAPDVSSVTPPTAPAGDEVAANGTFLGTRRGKVWLVDPVKGRKRACKVTAWPATSAEGNDGGTLRFVVPSRLTPGMVYDVRVQNGVGFDVAAAAFTAQ